MILAPDRRFIQEGTEPIVTLPTTQEDWNQFDVVIIGDVRPELFSEEQQKQLRDLVAQLRQRNFVYWGKQLHAAAVAEYTDWASVPFTGSASDGEATGGMHTWTEPVTMKREPARNGWGFCSYRILERIGRFRLLIPIRDGRC